MTRAEARATYEALREAQGSRVPVLPRCTVNAYEGGHDTAGLFHGKGAVESCMGFVYTGDFEHGQLEGQGTMTWIDGYTTEGLFRDGVPNGVVTVTWPNGDVYVGSVVNGVRHGGGTMVTQLGRATYDGGWVHGARSGWGRQCYPDGAVYEGEWRSDQRNGRGTLTYASGDCYEGEWVADVRQGHGVMGWKRGGALDYVELYDGEWHDGVPHGLGQSTYIVPNTKEAADRSDNGSAQSATRSAFVPPSSFAPAANAIVNTYIGSFVKGERNGWGAFYYADGSSYEGHWVKGTKTGPGTYTSAIGTVYHGTFADDEVPAGMPPLATVANAGPAVVPAVAIDDLRSINDGTQEAMSAKMTSLLLRFNTVLKALFRAYAATTDDVALAYTSQDWWRHRVPGHIGVPQLLRLLSDAGLVDGLVTISTVLRCVGKAVRARPLDQGSLAIEAFGVATADAIARSDGWLSFCQFTEVLIRLAPCVCLGVNHAGGVCDKFNSLVEQRLKVDLRCVPLCPLTRRYAPELETVLSSLKQRYEHLVQLEHAEAALPCESFLPVRSLLRHLQPLLAECELSLQESVRVMCAFQRSSSASQLPPGFNVPGRDRQLVLAQELYTTGCGRERQGTASLLVSGVIVELELSLVDFVEAVVALALAIAEKASSTDLRQIIETKILSLPL